MLAPFFVTFSCSDNSENIANVKGDDLLLVTPVASYVADPALPNPGLGTPISNIFFKKMEIFDPGKDKFDIYLHCRMNKLQVLLLRRFPKGFCNSWVLLLYRACI